MTREEQLVFCKKCQNRKFDMQKGIICGLTMEKATFQDQCPDFKLDESVPEDVGIGTEPLDNADIKTKLPADIFEKLRLEQNLPFGAIAGTVACLVGAVLWAVVTVSTGFQIGYMAIAVGAMVGMAIRYTGKGMDPIFGYMGAVLALLGCLLGNLFTFVGFIAQEYNLNHFDVLINLDIQLIMEYYQHSFSIIDLVFYAIALYEGYHFSFRVFTEEDIVALKNEHQVS